MVEVIGDSRCFTRAGVSEGVVSNEVAVLLDFVDHVLCRE